MSTGQILLRNTSTGAPVLSGTNGTLCSVLDWALPQAGWAIEYTATNARIYRPPAGNRYRLQVRHDSAATGAANKAVWRGCENATSATALVNEFPKVSTFTDAQQTVVVASAAGSTAQNYTILVSPTWLVLAIVDPSSPSGTGTKLYAFGDVAPALSDDSWNTLISAYGGGGNLGAALIGNSASLCGLVCWVRDLTGTVLGSLGRLALRSDNGNSFMMGGLPGCPPARSGYGNRIYREPLAANDCGLNSGWSGTSTNASAFPGRGWLPNLWSPLHSGPGALATGDTFTDSHYNASASLEALVNSAGSFAILETTDTWSAPA